MIAKYRVKLNSASSLQEMLQQIIDGVYKMLNEIQENINSLQNSVKLNEESLEAKAKYGKAIHDFLTDKDKAYKMLLDVSKLMSEVLKNGGDEKNVILKANTKDGVQLNSGGIDVNQLRSKIHNVYDSKNDNELSTQEYTLKASQA